MEHRDEVPAQSTLLLLARIALAAIFLYSSYGKLTNPQGFAGYLSSHGVPAGAYALATLAGAVEALSALALLIGFQARYAALMLALFTLTAALIGHRYWEVDSAQRANQLIHFWKNMAPSSVAFSHSMSAVPGLSAWIGAVRACDAFMTGASELSVTTQCQVFASSRGPRRFRRAACIRSRSIHRNRDLRAFRKPFCNRVHPRPARRGLEQPQSVHAR